MASMKARRLICLALGFLSTMATAQENVELRAGLGRCVITPPVGIELTGFAGRGPSVGIHDELLAAALALESGNQRAMIVTTDLLSSPEPLATAARVEIEKRTGVPAANIFICASHTHYGPSLSVGEGDDPVAPVGIVAAYLANLKFQLAGAAQMAVADLQPVRVGFGEGESRIGINRRERRADGSVWLGQNPDGACDRSLRLVRLDRADGRPFAVLVNFACHPVCGASQTRHISADWVGVMREKVEAASGARVLFLQGAAGNINPVEMRPGREAAQRLGAQIGEDVRKMFEAVKVGDARGLATASRRVDLPAMSFESAEVGEQEVKKLREQLERQKREKYDSGSIWWTQHRLQQAERALASLRGGPPLPPIPAEINALRFGDIALATAPGEIFCETGMEVKSRSPLPRTLYVGYTNGSIGYVPTPAAYAEGGYEVTHACKVGPQATAAVLTASLDLLEKVAGK